MVSRRLVFLLGFSILFLAIVTGQRKINDDDDDEENEIDNQAAANNIRKNGNVPNQPASNDNNPPVVKGPPPSLNQGQQPTARRSSVAPLAESLQCKADVQRFCNKGMEKTIPNLKVLQCIDDLDNAVNLISKECQHLIYLFKYNMTHDARFDDAALRQCDKDIKLLDECNEHTDERGSGRLVSCLYEKLENITQATCRYFINQLQAVVFNDWRLTEYFTDSCVADIRKFECGRLDDENNNIPHEQGAVVSCLSSHFRDIDMKCRKEISRLAEMQSNDYHLDRALYYACREDRDRLCGSVPSGNGRVYRCLYEQKFNSMMTPACRKEVHRRQSMVVANVKSDVPLIRACKEEMIQHQCNVEVQEGDKKSSLVKLLLCLEDRMKKGQNIVDECRREMLVHRRMLMSDYALSPELNSECKKEMIEHCPTLYQQGASGAIEQRGGRMIHCLLGAARREKSFSQSCLSVIKSLVRAVDPGSDIRADPLLETTCRRVIEAVCPQVKPGDSNVIMCLLDNLKSPRMTEECEDRLMEVAYFLARDWRLTPRLLRVCRNDLQTYCDLPKKWSMEDDLSDVQVGIYIGCLYQRRQTIDRECQGELKRLMHIRAQAIDLMPEIEANCITDLATCRNPDKKGEEMKCLQRKYESLEPQCRDAVRNYTQMTMSDPTLDFLLMKACEPTIQLYCSNIEAGNENDLIRCLIKHKHDRNMDPRCRAGIDHHQITSMKDEAFISQQFRTRCSKEIKEHCTGKKTKAGVIQCLADLMLTDVLKKQNSIDDQCQDELKFELLQRSENIEFDPLLYKACKDDVQKLCSDRSRGNAQIIDCLKEKRNEVSRPCFDRLRRREKIDVVAPDNDYSLLSKCGSVIQKFCPNENKQNLLLCLRRNSNQENLPPLCRKVLYHRLMILNSNGRFNKALIENCQHDVHQYCSDQLNDSDNDNTKDEDEDNDDENNEQDDNRDLLDRDMGGRIIQCLREKYADTKTMLEPQCVTELVDVIQTSKMDIRLDVKLYQYCKSLIDIRCTGMEAEDCLKLQYQKGTIANDECKQQVQRIIREGQADIHVDRALSFACQADILKFCNDIPIGGGKQLQCLLSMGKTVTTQCQNMLQKRQELWGSISKIDGISDLTEHIQKSNNSIYLFSVILFILCAMFMAGCVCRPYVRYSRVRKYK